MRHTTGRAIGALIATSLLFKGNTVLGNGSDCNDDSTGGTGTNGTGNTWIGNTGATSSPAGICTPPTP